MRDGAGPQLPPDALVAQQGEGPEGVGGQRAVLLTGAACPGSVVMAALNLVRDSSTAR